jgi:hypothetical protein
VPDKLRKYSTDVSVAAKGPPLRWLLTEKRVQKLRERSKLPLLADNTEMIST